MNYRLTSALLLLFLASSEAFSTVSRTDSFLGSTARSHNQFLERANVRQNAFGSVPKAPNTALSMSAGPVAGAIAGALTGGFFAGGLHAIAGPDHLAALLPRCCGQRWFKAGKIGALWGMGHGVSATIIGVLAFGLKNQVQRAPTVKALLAGASHVTEIAVGLSLIVIGVMGIKEAREWEDEVVPQSLSAAATPGAEMKQDAQKRAVMFNGLLHGFSWDGAPSLAPALAVATWGGNLAFLSAYAAGTMGAMAITTTLIGEGTRRAGEVFNRPDIPQKLSYFSSFLAIAIGLIWCGLAFKA